MMYEDSKKMERTIGRIRRLLKDSNHIEKPSLPELSFKPDLMIDLDKKLIFVEIAYLRKNENVDWKTLRLIEYLFEIKLFFGNHSLFGLIILDQNLWKDYCLELLEGFFDKVASESDIVSVSSVYATPKESNFKLWNLERDYQRLRSKKLVELNLEQFHYQPISARELEEDSYDRLCGLGFHPSRNFPIRNLKNYYLTEDMNLRFYFDFFFNNKIVEIKSFRKINSYQIQNLLIKARLIRYWKANGKIKQVDPIHKMILLANGNMSGPEYDQMRYLRMLTATGWDVYPADILHDEKKARGVFGDD